MFANTAADKAYQEFRATHNEDEKALADWFYNRYYAFKDIPYPVDCAVEIPRNYIPQRRCLSLIKARKMLAALLRYRPQKRREGMMESDRACCAHKKVVQYTEPYGKGVRDRWRCELCGHPFVPIPVAPVDGPNPVLDEIPEAVGLQPNPKAGQ